MSKCCEMKKTNRTDIEKKELTIRLNKIIGQMNGVKNMIEEDRYCEDILIQLSAIDKAIRSTANLMLERHMSTCLVKNIKEGNLDVVEEVASLYRRFL